MSLTVAAGNIHPTTEACIALMQRLHEKHAFSNILEIGCGGGVLSLVAATAWPQARVLAADIAPTAVEDTRALIRQNGRESQVEVIRSDGFSHPLIGQRGPYDLLICNLVAETLIRLSPDIARHLAPGGFAVVSGALAWLAADVEAAFMAQKLRIISKNSVMSWNSALLCHAADT